MSNLREAFGVTEPYSKFNREERHVVAMLFHTLMLGDNLQRFLKVVACEMEADPEKTEIFVEYSYLRDLWAKCSRMSADEAEANAKKRKAILDGIQPKDRSDLEEMSEAEFNAYFGAVPKASTKFIQSPATWSIGRFATNIADREVFDRACRFKWAFRIKPDLVIQPSPDRALCVEAKWESGEGSYPTAKSEIDEFDQRGFEDRVSQTTLQKFMMRELLGLEADFVYLVRRPGRRTATAASSTANGGPSRRVTWQKVFDALDLDECPPFIRRWALEGDWRTKAAGAEVQL